MLLSVTFLEAIKRMPAIRCSVVLWTILLKSFICWGGAGVNSFEWSEITFYGDALAELLNAICDHKTNDLLPQMTIFETVIPILTHLVTLSLSNMYCFAPTASVLSIVKPAVSQ